MPTRHEALSKPNFRPDDHLFSPPFLPQKRFFNARFCTATLVDIRRVGRGNVESGTCRVVVDVVIATPVVPTACALRDCVLSPPCRFARTGSVLLRSAWSSKRWPRKLPFPIHSGLSAFYHLTCIYKRPNQEPYTLKSSPPTKGPNPYLLNPKT